MDALTVALTLIEPQAQRAVADGPRCPFLTLGGSISLEVKATDYDGQGNPPVVP